jgi:hypothetical protein
MALYRFQAINSDPQQPVRDAVVNTFYLQSSGLTFGEDLGALCQDAAVLFRDYGASHLGEVKVQAYDMADEKPRRPEQTKTAVKTKGTSLGPREVALCLSYYAGQNVPRKRGRLYLGPWASSLMAERPGTQVIDAAKGLAQGIADLGGIDIQWVVYSPTDGQAHKVTNIWVDNEWDTIRSRGRRAEVRNAQALEG